MRSLLLVALSLFATVQLASAGAGLYTANDHVVELTATNFQSTVLESSDIWIVEFYAPWCGHCKSLAPEYVKAANALAGVVRLGALNMDEHQSIGGNYEVKGLPTIKIFGADKKKPTDYSGPRQSKEIVDAALKEATTVVKDRLAGKTSAGSPKKSAPKAKKASNSGSNDSGAPAGKVIDATESSFRADVLDNDDFVMVEFFAPWCGHCKSLAPEWKKAAGQLGGIAKMVAVDATVHSGLASKYGIKGYPTIKVFRAGKKDNPEDYNGGRTASDLVTFAKNAAGSAAPKPKPIVQVTSQAVLDEQCKETNSLCIVAILPHILDGGAKVRNAALDTLKTLAKKESRRPFGFVWMEAGAQPTIEDALLGGNTFYPAIVALNLKKSRYAPMVGTFAPEDIGQFMAAVMSGREKTLKLAGGDDAGLKVKDDQPWDGKDGAAPVEEKEL